MAQVLHPAIKPGVRREDRSTAARDRLLAQSERLAWAAYLRTLALQGAEPGPVSTIIRRAVYLINELTAALGKATTKTHVDRLIGLGLPPAAVDMCGTALIQPDGELYQPDDAGPEALVVPVFDSGETIDLLAFNLSNPDRWWLRLGVAAYLGGDALGDAVMDEPVRAFKTPLSWLRASAPADGLVVIDWDTAPQDLAYRNIVAEDLAHGEDLVRRLTVPALRPCVRVPKERAA